jgi:hypothetical protein
MRWWLNTDHKAFSVDNSFVRDGMDYSALRPDLWMVQWIDGRGEIEYQDPNGINPNGTPGLNLNGLRETFADIGPFAPYFQQFLRLMQTNAAQPLTLAQAQKVQSDLITEIYNYKRQLPFHYPVASGDYYWDATDATLSASFVPSIQNLNNKLNEVIAKLNNNMPALDAMDTSIVTQTNVVVGQANALRDETNSSIVSPVTSLRDELNTDTLPSMTSLRDQVNGSVVSPINDLVSELDGVFTNVNTNFSQTMQYCLLTGTSVGAVAAPGFTGTELAPVGTATHRPGGTSITPSAFSQNFPPLTTGFTALSHGAGVPWSPVASVQVTNQSWIPVGHTMPVPVTPAEAGAIMSGIAQRTQNLQSIKVTKLGEVAALTTIADAIAYDVTAGWPVIPIPPGYVFAGAPTGGGVTVVTPPAPTPPPTGEFPEAPINGLMYGRQSASWQRALALTNDVLDGGNF